jgi:hypothetical protein
MIVPPAHRRRSQTGRTALLVVACVLAAPIAAAEGNGLNCAPPDATHPWFVHDLRRPQPPVVTPGEQPGHPPSDAVVLFDGSEASFAANWEPEDPKREKRWALHAGAMVCVSGAGVIRTRAALGDVQLHLEWAAPAEVAGSGQGRGNSGIFLLNDIEVQVLDSYRNQTYPDGMAGALYGLNPPLANPLRPFGSFQSVDIIFRRPVAREGRLLDPGHATVLINGVVVQDAVSFDQGTGGHRSRAKPRTAYPDAAPLRLQDHGNPVRFRNIWYRPLPPRAVDGGLDGALAPEVALAKRRELAATVRAEAVAAQEPPRQLQLLFESLAYAPDPQAAEQAIDLAARYAERIGGLPAAAQQSLKDEIIKVAGWCRYAQDKGILPELPAHARLAGVIEAQGWKN